MKNTTCLLRLITVVYFFFCSKPSFAQNDTIYFFWNQDFKNVKQEKAVYQGITIREDNTWHMTLFHLGSRKKVLSSYFKDAALKERDGLFEGFYDQGEKKIRGYYNEGVKAGLWKEWDENGYLIDSAFFENNVVKYSYVWWYSEAHILKGYKFENNYPGWKILKSYNDDGVLISESEFSGKAGYSKEYYPAGNIFEFVKFDENGEKISFQHFRDDGTEMSEKEYEKAVEKHTIWFRTGGDDFGLVTSLIKDKPDFKGGREQFDLFVRNNLVLPVNFTDSHPGVTTVRFSFFLDKNGRAYNVKLIEPNDKQLEKSITDVLATMTLWEMKGNETYGPLVRVINIKR